MLTGHLFPLAITRHRHIVRARDALDLLERFPERPPYLPSEIWSARVTVERVRLFQASVIHVRSDALDLAVM